MGEDVCSKVRNCNCNESPAAVVDPIKRMHYFSEFSIELVSSLIDSMHFRTHIVDQRNVSVSRIGNGIRHGFVDGGEKAH